MLKPRLKSLVILLAITLAGCATQFTQANLDRLQIGMQANEVKELFGTPNEVRVAVCGENTSGGQWICERWTYTATGNYLTFSVKPNGKFLNDWKMKRAEW